jgi:ribosomal protein L7/L12
MTNFKAETLNSLIDILANKKYNAEQMVIDLAKQDPYLFVQLATSTKSIETNDNVTVSAGALRILQLIVARDHINAIKSVRTHYDLGLKEAKDIADNLRDYLTSCGVMDFESMGHESSPIRSFTLAAEAYAAIRMTAELAISKGNLLK